MKRIEALARLVISIVGMVVLASRADGAALNPSDVIVSWAGYPSSFVQELTPAGTLVQSWTITSSFGTEYARDIGVSSSGTIAIYNGTFSPSLTVINPATGATAKYSLAGWNTANNVTWGGLAVSGNYAYAADQVTGSDNGGQNGIARFNLTNGSAQRFFSGIDTTHIGIGLNNLLYAIWPATSPGQNELSVIDPTTMTLQKTIALSMSLSGVTADADGNIYATSGNTIYKLDANGNVLSSLNTAYVLYNIKISPTDQLIMDNNGGQVVMSSTSLASYTEFSLNEPNAQLFSSYAAFATSLPEPASGLALVLAGHFLLRRPARVRRSL